MKVLRTGRIKYAICTGCKLKIYPGPYFTRRVLRHIRLYWHNHDAAELVLEDSK